MNFEVFVTNEAEKDILDIYDYIAANESIRLSDKIFENLKHTCLSFSKYPDRGHIPPELERINLRSFKEIHYKPYRIIYQIIEKQVFIHCVFDGRRDLQEVLESRLLRS